ncbi:hypothetical protein DAPPUDRAFT_338418, partial [Daphnia pulex]
MRIGTHQDGKTIKLNRITKKSFPLYRIVDQPHLDFEIGHLKEKPLTLLDLGKTTAIKHHIVTNEATIVLPSYKTPFAHRPLLKKKILEMEAGKIIERSTSAFRSPLLIV